MMVDKNGCEKISSHQLFELRILWHLQQARHSKVLRRGPNSSHTYHHQVPAMAMVLVPVCGSHHTRRLLCLWWMGSHQILISLDRSRLHLRCMWTPRCI